VFRQKNQLHPQVAIKKTLERGGHADGIGLGEKEQRLKMTKFTCIGIGDKRDRMKLKGRKGTGKRNAPRTSSFECQRKFLCFAITHDSRKKTE